MNKYIYNIYSQLEIIVSEKDAEWNTFETSQLDLGLSATVYQYIPSLFPLLFNRR